MATATRKRTSKKNATQAQSTITKLNEEALKTTEQLIEGSIETGAKWQKLYAKSLKKSGPIIAKNINLAFDTAETMVNQYQKGSKRILALFGWDVKEVKKTNNKAISTAKKASKSVNKKVSSIAANTTTKASKVVKATKKTAASTKKELTAATSKMANTAKKAAPKRATTIAKSTSKPTSKVDSSNLKLINGVGPKMEALLKKEGYQSLESISKSTVADLKKVLDRADARYRLLNPESWVKDAKNLIK